jgi:arsenite methyltransferase
MAEDVRVEIRNHRGEYGYDGLLAGWLGMLAFGIALLALAVFDFLAGHRGTAAVTLAGSMSLILTVAVALHTTRRGKFVIWAELLENSRLRGDERVLDVGCGRGAVLTMIARLLPRGHVTGIDLWSKADQLGNGIDAMQRNLAAEGVGDRCEVVTGDMRAMPFPDASFDLVTSSLAIHNVRDREGRSRAIDEIIRVLKPGGRLMIADLAWTRSYARQLEARGLSEVRRRPLGWRFWWGLAIPSTSLVTALRSSEVS